MKTAATILILLTLASQASARQSCATPQYSFRPAIGNRPVERIRAQSGHILPTHDFATKVIVADAAFVVLDVFTRDVFTFVGPPTPVPAGLVVGVSAAGAEVTANTTVVPARQPAALPPSTGGRGIRDVIADDEGSDDGLPLAEYAAGASATVNIDSQPASSPLLSQALASLTAGGCATCHTAGNKPKGDTTLFSGPGVLAVGIDWKGVLAVVVPSKNLDKPIPPLMPPAGKGTYLTAAQIEPIRQLAKR